MIQAISTQPLRSSSRLWLWSGLLFYGLFLALIPQRPANPATLTRLVAVHNLAHHGRADINPLLWLQQTADNSPGRWGADGNLYPADGPGLWWGALPLIRLGQWGVGLNGLRLGQLGSVIVGALGAIFCLMVAVRTAQQSAAADNNKAKRWGWRVLYGVALIGLVLLLLLPLRSLASGQPNLLWLPTFDGRQSLALHLLLPAGIIIGLALINLIALLQDQSVSGTSLPVAGGITILLTLQFLWGATHLDQKSTPVQESRPALAWLTAAAQPGELLYVTSPKSEPIDLLDLTTHLLTYPLPVYHWQEGPAIPAAAFTRETVWQVNRYGAEGLWLYEAGLQPTDPWRETGRFLRQTAFPVAERWFDGGGRVTRFALPEIPLSPLPVNVPFAQGITLREFAILNAEPAAGHPLKLQLTWHMAGDSPLDLARPAIVSFTHLLAESQPGQVVAQSDQTLVDFVNHHQSPLLPGETVAQGYALTLPDSLPPDNYLLIIGLYDATSLQRLPRIDNSPDDFLYLTTLTLGANR